MFSVRLFTTGIFAVTLATTCGRPSSPTSPKNSPSSGQRVAWSNVPGHTLTEQPFVDVHQENLTEPTCGVREDCKDKDVCNRSNCWGSICMPAARNSVPCTTFMSDRSAPGTCFAGQCVAQERWAGICGRVVGHMYGKDISLVGYRYEVGKCPGDWDAARCLAEAKKSFEFLASSDAKDLVKCLQYPLAKPPEGYLYNWDGNDPGDYKGKGARQP